MADFLLSVGVDVGLSYDQMQKDISDLVTQLNQNPQRVRVGLEIDHSAIEKFRTDVANIHNSMGGLGRVTVSPVDTAGLNSSIDGIARMTQNTQGAISAVQTMRAELNSVNTERIQQAIASINGISPQGAAAIAQSLGEVNVRATEVRARLLEAAGSEQQLVALQVRGNNEAGHMVNYLMTYNTETGEISRRMVDITAKLEDATTAEANRVITVREITDLYRQMLALMRTNANANTTASYAELANHAQLLNNALNLARTESISIDEALTRLGTSGTAAIRGAKDAMSAFRLEIEQTGSSGTVNMTTMYDTVSKMQNLLNSNAGYANLTTYTNLQTQVNLLAQAIELASNGGITLETALAEVGLNGSTAIGNAREAMSAFKAEMSGATSSTEVLTHDNERYAASVSKVNALLRQVRENTKKWTAAKSGKSSNYYQIYADQADELENLVQRLRDGKMTVREFNEEYGRIKSTVSGAETAIRASGEATKSWSDRLGGLAAKFGTWFSITRVMMAAYRAIRKMVSAVIELDTAMTELKKVTNETEATYRRFLENATIRAKQLGASLSDTVSATSDFARLGYGIEDAEKLADAAIVYKNVGDGIDDISTASESIIATMQAFGVSAEDVMTIVDKFNEVGNNYAISSKGVGDALLRSAAAMNAANNTLDETIALATAANTIVQDPEKVGTTLKTVSMYLRAAKTEAEDAGESTAGMANSVSELREEILALTGNRVDIQIDEDTFKSTYEILKDLSKVWKDLSDISQANILEMVGGKRNSNVVAALLENFSVAENALKTSANAAGSALAENEKQLNSIRGRISIFKATFEELSATLIGSDFIKQIVNLGTWLLNVLNSVAKLIKSIGGLNTVLMATSGILVAIKLNSLIKLFSVTLPAAIMKLFKPLTRVQLVLKSFRSGTASAVPGTSRLSAAFKGLGLSAHAAQLAIGALTIAITAAVVIYKRHQQKLQEQRDAAIEAASSAETLSDEISDLANKYLALSESVKTDASAKDELITTQDELVKKLDLEKGRIDELVKKYGNLTDAIKAASVESLKEAERDLRGGLAVQEEALLGASKPHGVDLRSMSHIVFDDIDSAANHDAFRALEDAGYITHDSWGKKKFRVGNRSYLDWWLPDGGDFDLSTIEGTINAHKRLAEMLDVLSEKVGSDNEVYKTLYESYNSCTDSINNYYNSIGSLNDNLAEQYMLQNLIGREIPNTKEEFDDYRQSVINAAVESGEFVGSDKEIADAIDGVMRSQTQFGAFYTDELSGISGTTEYYKGQANSLTDVASKLQEAYSALDAAEKDMATSKGLTVDTIKALASAEENYLDYLYEENGVVKLNTEAWKERAKLEMSSNIDKIESTVSYLQSQREELEANAKALDRAGQMGKSMTPEAWESWNAAVEANNAALEQNGKEIDENQSKLKLYSALYNTIIGLLNTGPVAQDAFTKQLSDVQKLQSGFDMLEKIYSDVQDSGAFDWSLILNNTQFSDTFSSLGDAYTDFIRTISNSPDDLSSCRDAFNDLLTAYLSQSSVLENVTEDTRDATVAMLEQMGVANAAQIVDQYLARGKEYLRYSTENYTGATYEEILALYSESEAGSFAQEAIARLALEKLSLNETNISTSSDIEQLIALANTAGATSASLDRLARVKSLFAASEDAMRRGKPMISKAKYEEAIALLENINLEYNKLDPSMFEVEFGGGSGGGSYTGGGSSSSDSDNWFERQLKLHNHLVAMEQESHADYLKWLDSAYKRAYAEGIISLDDFYKHQEEVFQGLRELFEDYLGDIEHEISMREGFDGESAKIISLYSELISAVEKEIASARANGLDDSDDYIQSLQDKWANYKDEIANIEDEIKDNAKDAIEDLIDIRIDMLKQDIENEKDAIDDKLDYLKDFYDKQKDMLQDQYDEEKYLEEQAEHRKNVADIQAELSQLQYDDSAWAQKRKLELAEELENAQKELNDFERDHALETAQDQLDTLYEMQEKELDAQKKLLEEKANDAKALYEQALADIRNGSVSLYEEMIEWNNRYGDGISDTIKSKWEEAYKALQEYYSLYSKYYEDIHLQNATGYENPSESWDNAPVSGGGQGGNNDNAPGSSHGNGTGSSAGSGNTQSNGSSAPQITETIKRKVAAAIWDGGYGWGSGSDRSRKLTEVFGSDNGIQDLVNAGIGRNDGAPGSDYTYLNMRKKYKGYASGTARAVAGIHAIDELGTETIFESADGTRYKMFSGGEKVLNARASNFLYEFANSGGEILKNFIRSVFRGGSFEHIQPVITTPQIQMGDIIIKGNADKQTVSEIRRAQRENLSDVLREFSRLSK